MSRWNVLVACVQLLFLLGSTATAQMEAQTQILPLKDKPGPPPVLPIPFEGDTKKASVLPAGQGPSVMRDQLEPIESGHSHSLQQRPLSLTENPLDIAIRGRGYFVVVGMDGDLFYTRAGSFRRNQHGQITTQEGLVLHPGISIPDDALELLIAENGKVFVRLPEQEELMFLGQIELAVFRYPAGLAAHGTDFFSETAESGSPVISNPGTLGKGMLLQNHLEQSPPENEPIRTELQEIRVELRKLQERLTSIESILAENEGTANGRYSTGTTTGATVGVPNVQVTLSSE